MTSTTRLFLAAALAALTVPATAAATTYTVNPGEKIQAAVDKAAAGDTIQIKAGTYAESVTVPTAGLTIAGEAGVNVVNPSSATGSTPTFSFTATSGEPDVLTGLTVANAQTTGPAVKAPTVGLVVRDSVLIGSKGDALDFGGSAKDLVQRTYAISLVGAGVGVSTGTGGGAETLTIDSSALVGKQSLSAAYATPTTAGAAGMTIAARHVTAVGDVVADASAATLPLGANPIAVTFADSIVRGKRTATASSGGVGATITADTARNSVADTASDAASLFVNAGRFNFHLRADAPVIGKGGLTTGESDTDIDGQPRAVNGVSDLGADQFVDRAPKAAIAASVTTPRQNQAVTLDASQSADPDAGDAIVSYQWDFGDGQQATTTTPTTTHAYAARGPFTAKVTVVDRQGTASDPATVGITVTDGVPPTIRISSPFNHETIRAYKGRRRLAVQFFGSAADDVAMGRVLLALRPVTKRAGQCRWFDGKSKLKTGACTAPTLFAAAFSGTQWRYRLPVKARLPKGLYFLYAAPVDASGLPGTTKSVKFRIR